MNFVKENISMSRQNKHDMQDGWHKMPSCPLYQITKSQCWLEGLVLYKKTVEKVFEGTILKNAVMLCRGMSAKTHRYRNRLNI